MAGAGRPRAGLGRQRNTPTTLTPPPRATQTLLPWVYQHTNPHHNLNAVPPCSPTCRYWGQCKLSNYGFMKSLIVGGAIVIGGGFLVYSVVCMLFCGVAIWGSKQTEERGPLL